MCAQLQEIPIELLRKLLWHLAKKETPIGDDYCNLSHNCPSKEIASLVMSTHLQFCIQASMHSNTTRNFGFCNCRMQLKFSCMRHIQLQICVVA